MIKLIWFIVTIGPQGPINGQIQDELRFDTPAQCQEYAERMSPRVEDWVRGALNAPWSHPVAVNSKCDEGEPA